MRIEARVPESLLATIRAPLLERAPDRIDPPVIQPLDLLLDLSGEAMRDRLFVVQGEGGAEACLRPDFTIPLARHFVGEGGADAQYYYEGQAFRIAPPGLGDSHPSEFLQIGIETYGGGRDALADAQLAGRAWRSAVAGGRTDLTIRIGDVGFFSAMLADIGVHDLIAARLRRAFTRPSRLRAELARAARPGASVAALSSAEIAVRWSEQGLDPVGGRTADEIAARLAQRQAEDAAPRLAEGQVARITDYLAIAGPAEQAFKRLGEVTRGDAFNQESRWWNLLIEHLPAHGVPADRITFDAGFGGPFSYYDGLVFEITSAQLGRDVTVAAGGRYDALLAQLSGRPIAAAGFMVRPARAWNGSVR